MSAWPRVLQGLLLACVVFLAVVYLGSAASLPPTDTQSIAVEDQTLPEGAAPDHDRPVPTRRPGIQLVLGDIECEDGGVAVNFLVLRLPENVSAHGEVTYYLEGDTTAKTAAFKRQVGPVGQYSGRLAGAGEGRYNVTSASITLAGVTAELVNPHAVTVRCRPGEGTARPTEPRETPRTPRPTEPRETPRTPRPTEPRETPRTPRPTETHEPTRTPRATESPRPTRTPEPTRTARPLELRLDGIACVEGRVQIHFVVGRLPEGTTAASLAATKVDFSMQVVTLSGPTTVTGQAAFQRLNDGVAHYVAVYPATGAPQDGVYIVTAGTLNLAAGTTLTLPFPTFPGVIRGCGVR